MVAAAAGATAAGPPAKSLLDSVSPVAPPRLFLNARFPFFTYFSYRQFIGPMFSGVLLT